jgi:hypothetical protein
MKLSGFAIFASEGVLQGVAGCYRSDVRTESRQQRAERKAQCADSRKMRAMISN